MVSAGGATVSFPLFMWTHSVRLARSLPATRDEYDYFDGRVVYCKLDRDSLLRAVMTTDLAKRGEPVAYWDPAARNGHGDFVYQDGTSANVIRRTAQWSTKVKPHVTVMWVTDTMEDGSLVCFPWRVVTRQDGSQSASLLKISNVFKRKDWP